MEEFETSRVTDFLNGLTQRREEITAPLNTALPSAAKEADGDGAGEETSLFSADEPYPYPYPYPFNP